METVIIVLTALLILATIGWIKNRVALLSLISYLQKKGYACPTDAEVEESTRYVVKNLFKH